MVLCKSDGRGTVSRGQLKKRVSIENSMVLGLVLFLSSPLFYFFLVCPSPDPFPSVLSSPLFLPNDLRLQIVPTI